MSAQNYTITDVSAALSRLFVLPPEHEGIVRYSGALLKTVNESPEFRKGGLQGGGFMALALSSAPGELLAAVDPAQRDKLQREMQTRANVTSAESVARGNAFDGREGLRLLGRQDNSNRFSDLPDGERMTLAMLAAKELALKTPGMGWAAQNYDLLRIPGAVETLIQAKIREESYKAAKDAGFSDRDNVAAVKWAIKNGKDGNKVLDNMAESQRIFGGNDPATQERWRKLFNNLHTSENPEQAKEAMNQALKREENSPDPARREQAAKARQATGIIEKAKTEADLKDSMAVAKQTRDVNANSPLEASLAAFDSVESAVAKPATVQTGTASGQPTQGKNALEQPKAQPASKQTLMTNSR